MVKNLTKTELAQTKKLLLERKHELEDQLQQLAGAQLTVDQVKDTGDQVLLSVMESLRNSLQDSEYQEYVRIIKALQAIDQGTYGVCAICGELIAQKRLKYNPVATRCIACQEAFEAEQ